MILRAGYVRIAVMSDPQTTDREMLELAAYKIGEMLNAGFFEAARKANFERALARIKEYLDG